MAVSVNSVSSNSVLSTGVQGIQSGLNRANQAAGEIARSGTTEQNGDLAKSIVDLKSSELQVKASAKVIKTADDLLGTLIDTTA
jgi:flagellar hook protein FlgE